MAEFRTALDCARQVLAFCTCRASFPMEAHHRASTGFALRETLTMLAKAGPTAFSALEALLPMDAKAGPATFLAYAAPLAVFTKFGAPARFAFAEPFVVRALLSNSFDSLHWVWRRRGWH